MPLLQQPKENLKKQLTLIFVLIFLLIKVSPGYYRYQSLTVASGRNMRTILQNDIHAKGFHIRVDKAIAAQSATSAIPGIKFSGIFIELFSFALCLMTLTSFGYLRYLRYQFPLNKRYITCQVFRL